jgi:hypothetical protein
MARDARPDRRCLFRHRRSRVHEPGSPCSTHAQVSASSTPGRAGGSPAKTAGRPGETLLERAERPGARAWPSSYACWEAFIHNLLAERNVEVAAGHGRYRRGDRGYFRGTLSQARSACRVSVTLARDHFGTVCTGEGCVCFILFPGRTRQNASIFRKQNRRLPAGFDHVRQVCKSVKRFSSPSISPPPTGWGSYPSFHRHLRQRFRAE